MPSDKTAVEFGRDEALVLYAWLSRFNAHEQHEFVDQAEQRVLWDLEATLESALTAPLAQDYEARLDAARERVRDADEPA